MHFDNPCTGKEYPKDETKQTKIQANVIWKPSIIVERFSVSYNCCIIANHCYCSRPCSDSMDIRKRDDFFFGKTEKYDNKLLISCIYYCLLTMLDEELSVWTTHVFNEHAKKDSFTCTYIYATANIMENSVKEYTLFYFELIVFCVFFFPKHFTTKCNSCI